MSEATVRLMRFATWLGVLVIAGGLLVGGDDFAWAWQGLQAPTYTLHGTVVNSATNEPIRNALVTLSFEGQRFELTGADGTFQFEGLTIPGQGWIDVKKPGYFSPQDVRTSRNSMTHSLRAITVGPDQPALALKLIPEGVISGRISGEGGEPIDSLPVRVLFEGVEKGKRVLQEVRSRVTDEEGEFRAAELVAGRYFLFVGPGEGSLAPGTRGQNWRGYPGVFYSGASDFASASPIEITPGKRAEINMALSRQPFFRVAGTISGLSARERAEPEVYNSAGLLVETGSSTSASTGAFEVQPLPPGSYTITVRDFQQILFASRRMNLNSDVSDVHLTLLPGLSIPTSVRVEVTHNDSQTEQGSGFTRIVRGNSIYTSFGNQPLAQVTFTSNNSLITQMQGRQQFGRTGSGDSFVIEHVSPGSYTVHIDPSGPYYVKSARSGSTDLLREDLDIAPGASVQPIQIVLRDDFANLKGKVSYDAGVESAIVLAMPEDNPGRARQIVANQPGGAFELQMLAPGLYKVLAVDRVDNFAYAEPEILEKYLSKARDITLLPDQTANVDLELVRVGE